MNSGRPRPWLLGAVVAAGFAAVLLVALLVHTRTSGPSTGSARAVASADSPAASEATASATVGTPAATATVVTPAATAAAAPPTSVSGKPSPAASAAPASLVGPGTITLTNADNGRQVALHTGTTVAVELTADPVYRWTEPDTSNAAVMRRSGGSTGSGGGAGATFVAGGAGTANLSATENPNCYPQCLAPSRLWSVTVTVSG